MSEVVNEAPEGAVPVTAPKVDPESLVLRARPARAIRFKRGVIVSLAAVAGTGVVATAWFALEPRAIHLAADGEDKSMAAKAPTDTLSALPTSYGMVPKLGPPLPGDLGRPILERQRQLAGEGGAAGPPAAPAAPQPVDDARQRRLAELKAARESGLLVQTGAKQGGEQVASGGAAPAAPATGIDQAEKVPVDTERDPNAQQRKAEFVRTTDRSGDVNPHAVAPSPSPFTLSAGSVISASLITGLRSDLPGIVTAQVTERIFDTATGRALLIPQGARLIGAYDIRPPRAMTRAANLSMAGTGRARLTRTIRASSSPTPMTRCATSTRRRAAGCVTLANWVTMCGCWSSAAKGILRRGTA